MNKHNQNIIWEAIGPDGIPKEDYDKDQGEMIAGLISYAIVTNNEPMLGKIIMEYARPYYEKHKVEE